MKLLTPLVVFTLMIFGTNPFLNAQCSGGISSFPYSESFESSFGAWSNDTNDDSQWLRDSGGTPSSGTGPSGASDGTWYSYFETSSPNYPSKIANFNGPCFNFSSFTSANITFKYHMYGTAVGSLRFDVSTNNGSSWITLWTQSGSQGNVWQSGSVNLDSYTGQSILVRFSGTSGTSWSSDMAVDEIVVTASGSGGGGQPDLFSDNLTGPTSADPGASITIGCRVRNTGTAAAGSTSSLRYYLSTNTTYDGSDTYLGVTETVSNLAVNAAEVESANVTVPSSTTPGSYYILYRSDYLNQVAESNESNNVSSKAITINSSGGGGGGDCDQWTGDCNTTANIYRSGKVGIGISSFDAQNYKLYVKDGIKTEEVKVELCNGWCDYVFEPDYKLAPLAEVRKFIQDKKHLPNMPSAAELEADGGFGVSEMTTMQQEKIEELFLYVLEMESTIQSLKEQVTTLEKALNDNK